jgi:hypothetical protein
MFVQDPVCQNPVCQDQVCQDHVCQDHVMIVKTISSMSGPYHVCLEYVIFLRPCHRPAMSCLSRICHFFDHVCQEYVIFLRPCHVCHDSVYKFNMFCKHILSTYFVNIFCQQFSFIYDKYFTILELKDNNKDMYRTALHALAVKNCGKKIN